MKKPIIHTVLFLSLILVSELCAQDTLYDTWTVKDRNWSIEMLFPGGKTKALILSFDDGPVEDRKMIALLNKYGLKGTFHLNSGRFDQPETVSTEEIKTLYRGHEVSVHSYNHLGMNTATDLDMFYEVGEDRRVLEALSGQLIRGMAYPFGSYNTETFETLTSLGMEYGRTIEDSYDFTIPSERLLWHPTIHMFGKAGYMGNPEADDLKEYDLFDSLTQEFLSREMVSLYYVWGHTWEYKERWDKVEAFLVQVNDGNVIAHMTHIELIDYLDAYRNLRISADKMSFFNPSVTDVFLRLSNYSDLENPRIEIVRIPAGATIQMTK